MKCRDFRDVVDSFLSNEVLTETNHEILQHLDTCLSCRVELGTRQHLRDSLRAAFGRAPDLKPESHFAERLREHLRVAAADVRSEKRFPGRWLMVAAGFVLAAGVAGAMFMTQLRAPVDALARDAIGDHWNCALKNRKVRTPVPLEEAAQRFDRGYLLLLTAPPDDIATPHGVARVVDRHSCAFGTRRFGHVILQYREHVVSLLVTAEEQPQGVVTPADMAPHLHGGPVNGLSVASVRGARHAILLVSDLERDELTQLSTTVSVPLAEQLVYDPIPSAQNAIATFLPVTALEPVFRRGR